MFIRGLHYKMREHLALINPNPNNLQNLFRDAINIENLTKRNDIREYYLTHQDRRNYNQDGRGFIPHQKGSKSDKIFSISQKYLTIPKQIRKKKEEEKVYALFVGRPDIYNSIALIRRNQKISR